MKNKKNNNKVSEMVFPLLLHLAALVRTKKTNKTLHIYILM